MKVGSCFVFVAGRLGLPVPQPCTVYSSDQQCMIANLCSVLDGLLSDPQSSS